MAIFLKRSLPVLGFSLGLLLSVASPSSAFKLEPISHVFAPSGPRATQSYEVRNTTNDLVAIEVSTAKREMDLQGKEMLTPAGDDFMIYPPQILLKPGESQTVRVTWLGDPQPDQELAYRLIAAQLPVDLDPKKDDKDMQLANVKVKLAMRYEGSLYIRPTAATADVVIEQIMPKMDGDRKMLAITFHNQGTSRAILNEAQVRLTSNSQSQTFTAETIGLNKVPVLLANEKRQILIPQPAGFDTANLSGTVTLGKQK